ncbi:unnamed protein product [Orchesella dallaii]|uniref:O-acyltransferase WSD1 C-terminal domain-containing protein n=1 Tax=Orchesella dallaii TaxID=48710 RepID=A0ABP1Q8W5_9HEXA
MSSPKKRVYQHLQIIKVILRAPLVLLTSLLMSLSLLLWLPVYIFRLVAISTGKLRPSLGKILTPMDLITFENFHPDKAPKGSLVATALLEEDITVESVQRLFKDSLSQSSSNFQLLQPKLQQYQSYWLGFAFWKNDPDFQIQNHVVEYSNPVNNLGSVAEVHEHLLNKTFVPKRSPWELLVLRNCNFYQTSSAQRSCTPMHNCNPEVVGDPNNNNRQGQTLLALRIHHTLGDGISVLKLFVQGLGKKTLVKATPKLTTRSVKDNLVLLSTLPFSIGEECLKFWYHTLYYCRSHLRLLRAMDSKRARKVVAITELMSMSEVKSIAKESGVTFSAVILTIITCSLRKLIIRKEGKGQEIVLPTGYILPVDGHPNELANHWAFTYTFLRLSEMGYRERLINCNEIFINLKTSAKAYFLRYGTFLVGTIFHALSKYSMKNRICSTIITNIAGDEEGFSVQGKKCVDFSLTTGGNEYVGKCVETDVFFVLISFPRSLTHSSHHSFLGLTFCIMSYKGAFRICAVADQTVLPQEKVDKLSYLMYDEFQNIKYDILKPALSPGNVIQILEV